MTLNVLSVASEVYPLIKTGGLADVAGALPAALAAHDVAVTTLVPLYPVIARGLKKPRVLHVWSSLMGAEARLLAGKLGDHPLLLLDCPALFAREGGPYTDAQGRDFADNWRRFAALSKAAAEIGGGMVKGLDFDLVHAHDWQAAMTPAYLHYGHYLPRKPKTVTTIHNMAFQGQYGRDIFASLELPPQAFSVGGVEYFGDVGFLKAGLALSNAITTVSPSYAVEIRDGAFGMGLEGLIAARADAVHGILNGIDHAVWNPASDPALAARYTARTLAKRRANKRAIEKTFGLMPEDGPLFIVISRLTWQKGMDVLADVIDGLVHLGARLAVLGAGDAALEAAFHHAGLRHPGRVALHTGYDEPLSHLMQGGGDAILVPSRFEPCGLTQLYGLAYGCVPVVARTGGLADTVIDANAAALAAGVATGVQFNPVSGDALYRAILRTTQLYADKAAWSRLQRGGMAADFSWRSSGRHYARLYKDLVEKPA